MAEAARTSTNVNPSTSRQNGRLKSFLINFASLSPGGGPGDLFQRFSGRPPGHRPSERRIRKRGRAPISQNNFDKFPRSGLGDNFLAFAILNRLLGETEGLPGRDQPQRQERKRDEGFHQQKSMGSSLTNCRGHP